MADIDGIYNTLQALQSSCKRIKKELDSRELTHADTAFLNERLGRIRQPMIDIEMRLGFPSKLTGKKK